MDAAEYLFTIGLVLHPIQLMESGVSFEWLCKTATALRDPTARAIVLRLAGRPMTTAELARETGIALSFAKQAIGALQECGVIAMDSRSSADINGLSDSVAVAFAAGNAEARITAPDGDVVSFICERASPPSS